MYIKNIELQGFKSFLHKTNIVLERGITTIVGPNGCGKTNIIDAVRWVLGEHKQSTLRSSKMEDIIFNGTQKIKPINFCEVKLRIENDANILPLEYSEVEIARRLFRDGESEYFINKNPCRLKDIHELFIDTGMSANAYSVIELKMIESILSNDGSNFKRMLDEAAGISNYNQKRKSAKNTLKRTLGDLDRINDIVYEIEKNMKGLNLQLKRYKRHEVLIEKLRDKEILKSILNISLLENDAKPILKKLKFKSNDELKIEKELKKEQKLLKNFEEKYNLEKKELSNIKNSIQENNNDLHILNASIIKYTENKKYNNSQMEYCNDQIFQCESNIKHINKKIDSLNLELQKIKPTILSQSKDFSNFEKKYIKEKEKKKLLIKKIDEERELFNQLYISVSNIKNQIKIINSEHLALSSHLLDLNKFKYDKDCKYCVKNGTKQINEKKDIKIKIKSLDKDLKISNKKLDTINRNYENQNKKIIDLNNSIKLNNKEDALIDKKFQDLKIKNIELNKEKEGLEYRINSFFISKTDSENQINNFKDKKNSLLAENKNLDTKISVEMKNSNHIKSDLKKMIKKENDLEIKHDKLSIKLKTIQQNMMLNQRNKESKIIDRQNFELKLSEINNQKKIIENFVMDKYGIDIYKVNNIKNQNVTLEELSNEIEKIKVSIDNIGPINMAVKSEYETEKERFEFVATQRNDLVESEKTLEKTIKRLDKEAKIKFLDSFNIINKNLLKTFPMFFDGGKAFLELKDFDKPLESDIEIIARPPGKKNKSLKMLSAGEKALSATAILFAIYLKKPSPFCILDEIDAPLDDHNIKKFTDVIKSFSNKTQFIVITHNKLTMQESDYMYGITQEENGISKLVSVKLADKA